MKLKLTAIKPEAPGVESLIFKPAEPIVWQAGQYLHYVLNHAPTDDRGSDRWFTISSAPYERHIVVTTRFASAKGSTFKKTMKALKPGDNIEITDVEGDFTVTDPKKEYVFIAGGIGITPFRSILMQAAHEGTPLRVTLLYVNRNPRVTYKKELESMRRRNPNFTLHYIFSPQRIDKEMIQNLAPNLKKSLVYVSGPEPMVENVGKMLKELGIARNRIKQDWFPGYPEE